MSTITYSPLNIQQVIPHQGRIVVFLNNGAAFERATDGSWSSYEVAEGTFDSDEIMTLNYGGFVAASVLLG